jgi:S-adenosylmethionine decarboxylase proenzyme|tara:strand:- start:32 stop:415 length:384 start_codon:yes stop_codon:yes gene_type:complete
MVTHFPVARFWECEISISNFIICENYDILNSLEKLEELSDKLIKICKLTKLSELKHKFEPQGITLITLLSESHLSMHTWPENKSICIDIFSCSDYLLVIKKIKEILSQYFVINKSSIKMIERTISKL